MENSNRYGKPTTQNGLLSVKRHGDSKVEQEGSVPLTKFLGEFYVYGKEPATYIESDTGELSTIDFRFSHRIAYTPLENTEQLTQFWRTTVDYYGRGARQYHSDALLSGWLEHLPERDEKVRLLVETLFTPDYFMNTIMEAGEEKLTTISPRDFIAGYARLGTFYRKKISIFHGLIETLLLNILCCVFNTVISILRLYRPQS